MDEQSCGDNPPAEQPCPEQEVFFIDENTPTPELPIRQPYVPVSQRRAGELEVIYIGPEEDLRQIQPESATLTPEP